MKCTEFADRLDEVLDLRLSPADDNALQVHADQCADCREMLAAQESLFAGLARLQGTTNPPDFGRRVLAELQPAQVKIELPPPLVRPRAERNWVIILSSAALVLIAVSFSVWVANRNLVDGPGAKGGRPSAQGPGLAVTKPIAAKPQQFEPTLANPPAAALTEAAVVVPKATEQRSPALPNMDQAMASLASRWPQAGQWPPVDSLNVQQVELYAPSIRPIRESFEVALDALLKTLPGKKDAARPTQPQALQPHDGPLHIA